MQSSIRAAQHGRGGPGGGRAPRRDRRPAPGARAARLRVETSTNSTPPIDESVRAFIATVGPAIVAGKKADLETKIVSGELVRFINASFGTTAWETRVLRTEQINSSLTEADVTIHANKLGKDGSGTAVFVVTRTLAGLKLAAIEFFEVQ